MIFDQYFKITEQLRWNLEKDINWKAIDVKKARTQKELLKVLRDATLIESYAPISHMRMLELHWDDLEVSGVLSIQLYEEYKHYHVLKRYLDHIGLSIPDSEILAKRKATAGETYSDPVSQLAKYFISEHFTGHFYVELVKQAKDPVLKQILKLIAGDEFRHSQLYYDLLKEKIASDPDSKTKVLDFMLNFEHFGAEVVEEVPISHKNDFKAIVQAARKVEKLCGMSPQDYIRQKMESADATPN